MDTSDMKTFARRYKNIIIGVGLIILLLVLVIIYFQIQTKIYDPFGSKTYFGKAYYPQNGTSTPASHQNVFLDGIQLITPEEIFNKNTTAADLANFTEQIDKKAQQVFAENNAEFKLLVQVTIYPTEHFDIKIATQGQVDNSKLSKLQAEIQSITPIYAKTDNLVLQIVYTVKASR
jgi:hypothetical protein